MANTTEVKQTEEMAENTTGVTSTSATTEVKQTEEMAENTTGVTSTSATTEAETDPYVDKLAPIYHKATAVCSKMMEPIHEMNIYVDKKNELDEQYKDQAESEDYKNAVKELQTNTFGEDIMKINIANRFEKVHDFADSYGITAFGDAFGTVSGKLKDAFSQTSVGQKLEDIKMAAAEIEDSAPEVASGEKIEVASGEKIEVASGEKIEVASGEKIEDTASTSISGISGVDRGAQADSFLGVNTAASVISGIELE